MTKVLAVLMAVLAVVATAATPTLLVPASPNTKVETKWQAVPTDGVEVACAQTIWLEHIVFSTGADARTITAVDAQGSPVTWMTAVSLSANQLTVIVLPTGGIRMQGGFKVTASGSGVVYQFRGGIIR